MARDSTARTGGEASSDFSADESMAELHELAISAGADVVGEFIQSRERPDPATLIGRGKLEEIAGAAASARADLVIFDHDLSPSQQRNVEDAVSVRVIDRTQLILDIFARHARTREGQLQVELAQLEYLLPRLTGRGIEMSQIAATAAGARGPIGTRGPGETQLETDRRKIFRRIRHIQQQVENVRRSRAQQRQRRESVPVATLALVGYTNAGKSTLFNALTRAGVLESPRLFATLDPTIRAVQLPSRRKVLLSDTVGFIRNLPHTLVTSFRATLEEVQRASLLLEVSDATSPIVAEQDAQVDKVLRELQAQDKPRLRVINKIDLLPASRRDALQDDAGSVHVSAVKGIGISTLLERIDGMLQQDALSRVKLRVPQREGKTLAMLEGSARVFSREYRDGFVDLDAQVPESLLRKVRSFVRD
ncbi:MAG TPA: GTPase HflX [Terriglobales bacterium]|jgi:GTP-binding protein HflX|nr:GTPase HflX [Terriglobales bacterium]